MKLTFKEIEHTGDMDKEMPMKLVEDVTVGKDEEHPIEDEFNKAPKFADMYHGFLFTVVPKDFDMHNDILPTDQDFEPKNVLLWDAFDSLFKFKDDIWKKLRIRIHKDELGKKIFKGTADTYYTASIPSEWIVGEEFTPPRYVE